MGEALVVGLPYGPEPKVRRRSSSLAGPFLVWPAVIYATFRATCGVPSRPDPRTAVLYFFPLLEFPGCVYAYAATGVAGLFACVSRGFGAFLATLVNVFSMAVVHTYAQTTTTDVRVLLLIDAVSLLPGVWLCARLRTVPPFWKR